MDELHDHLVDKMENPDFIRKLYNKPDVTVEPKDLKDKKIREIMNKDTVVCDDLGGGWDETIIKFPTLVGTVDNTTVIHTEDYVFIFDGQKLRAVFHVYEVHGVSLNKQRGLVTAVGHETVHEYWLDNGEYKRDHTR